MPVLEARGLGKSFGGLKALADLSLSVEAGEILGLIGPNGAGKTTALNLLTGFIRPDTGSVFLEGQDVTGLAPFERARIGLVRTFQLVRPFRGLSALENVIVGAYQRTGRYWEAVWTAHEVLNSVGLDHRRHQMAEELGQSDLRRLELARALSTAPRVLLLDEVMAGLTLAEQDELMDLIRSLRDRKLAVLLVEHSVRVVSEVCDRVVALNYGVRIAEGSPSEVLANADVVAAYLGGDSR